MKVKLELGRSWAKCCSRVLFLDVKVGGDSASTTSAVRATGSKSRLSGMTVKEIRVDQDLPEERAWSKKRGRAWCLWLSGVAFRS